MSLNIEKITEVFSKWENMTDEEHLDFYYLVKKENEKYDVKYQDICSKITLYNKYKRQEQSRTHKERLHDKLLSRLGDIEEKEEVLRIDTKVKNERAELEKGKKYIDACDIVGLDITSDAISHYKEYLDNITELIKNNLHTTPYSERDNNSDISSSEEDEKTGKSLFNEYNSDTNYHELIM